MQSRLEFIKQMINQQPNTPTCPLPRSFSLLDAILDMAREGDEAAAARVPELLESTISACEVLADLVHRCV